MSLLTKSAAAFVALGMLAPGWSAYGGPYSGPTGDGGNIHDPGIPGFVGPDGDGKVSSGNVVNPIFAGWATKVIDYSPAPGVGSISNDPTRGLGPVTGNFMDVVSLGDLYASTNAPSQGVRGVDYGVIGEQAPGSITLGFAYGITNGLGADFAIFENGFLSQVTTSEGSVIGLLFAELAYVEVSTDGVHFAQFPSISLTPGAVGGYGTVDPTDLYNLAGKHANGNGVSWGTPFDLDDLAEHEYVLSGVVDLNEINFVRIVDIPGSGDFKDSEGRGIYDSWVTWGGSGGFDFEALGVIHQIPEPSVLALGVLAMAGAFVASRRFRL